MSRVRNILRFDVHSAFGSTSCTSSHDSSTSIFDHKPQKQQTASRKSSRKWQHKKTESTNSKAAEAEVFKQQHKRAPNSTTQEKSTKISKSSKGSSESSNSSSTDVKNSSESSAPRGTQAAKDAPPAARQGVWVRGLAGEAQGCPAEEIQKHKTTYQIFYNEQILCRNSKNLKIMWKNQKFKIKQKNKS